MPDAPFDPSYMIETRGDGRLAPPSDTEQVRTLVTTAAEHGHLVVHLHGGLVPAKAGRAGAAAMAPRYREWGAAPVAFVWRTGPAEILCGNLGELMGEDFFEKVLKLALRFVVGRLKLPGGGKSGDGFAAVSDLDVNKALASRAAAAEPFGELDGTPDELDPHELGKVEQTAQADPGLRAAAERIVETDAASRGLVSYDGPRVETAMDPEILAEIGGGDAAGGGKGLLQMAAVGRHVGRVVFRVVKRFAQGRAHGVYCTSVEEICREFYVARTGGALWKLIKDEAEDTFHPGLGAPRGGRLFVDTLAAAFAAGRRPRITVVGHSAGSIFAAHLVRELAAVGIQVDDLVLLAAAARFSLFGEALGDAGALAPRRQHHIALSEECESGYWEVPVLYPRSLLYMVSGAAELGDDGKSLADEPLLGMQRFWDRPKLVLAGPPSAQVAWEALAAAKTRLLLGRRDDGSVHRHGGLTSPDEAEQVMVELGRILTAPA